MFFINRKSGKLVNKENINGNITYTMQDINGKTRKVFFDTDVCPHAKIGDDIFYVYDRNAFSKEKKGRLLGTDLKEISILTSRMMQLTNMVGVKEHIASIFIIPGSMMFSVYFLTYLISFLLRVMNIKHLSSTEVYSILCFILGISIVLAAGAFSYFIRKTEYFRNLRISQDKYFNSYKKENFTTKERILNKKMSIEEKDKLLIFVESIDKLSSTEKIEISSYIENKKNMRVGDITTLDILNVRNKLNIEKQVKQLLLR